MNMAISTTPVSTGKTSSSSSPSSSAGLTTGSGFAGALVQAIDGNSTSAEVSAGLSLPVGLAGLLGQLGTEESSDEAQGLLEMLNQLVSQLQQLEQGDLSTLSPEAEEQLAALLAAFQNVLQQLSLGPAMVASEQVETPDSSFASVMSTDASSAKPVVKALRETLQQLSTAIASGKDGISLASGFAGQLKNLLDSLAPQVMNANLAAQTATANASEVQAANKSTDSAVSGTAVPTEAMKETAAVAQEPRRPVQALRDPVWRFNVTGINDAAPMDGQTAVVTSVTAVEEASHSDSQPAWTFMQNDKLAADSAVAKAAMPAQVPVQQFAEQIEKFLVKQFQLTQGNGVSEAKLSLTPEHLGQVDIRIVMQNGQVTAHFMTENAMARDLLENQMSQLRTALSGQGMQVDRLEVVQQPSSSAGTSFMQQEHRQSNSGNGNGSNGQGKGDYEDPAVFAAELERNSSLKEFGFGSSLNVMA
ncbi:flagellar hook-length control protein FliK [Cohnella luojiensis]|uniref:Flagellar hook-length control protein FliK n=1 Tax=Cohnella luojiensis TaxID=652876 RepID=A0A4Y8LTU4_9BACL|nr:flagellar hook-length control protein FliK [Cohnella luojiensis]TFE24426.1 flagellar hook-length control protein FliK [Cohnella luojiensis]